MIHVLFERIAAYQPNKVALLYQNQTLNYDQLNLRANQIAHKLKKHGVTSGSLVAIFMKSSIEMVISIMAILKAGAAYIPIDTTYPKELITYILEDSTPQLILTSTDHLFHEVSFNNIETIDIGQIKSENTANLNIILPKNALAYIIYTSGSTGYPKGVMVEHRNVKSLITAVDMKFSSSDIWTLYHSTSFDFSVWELFGALLTGGTLVIVPYEVRKNFREFRRMLIEKHVTILNQTPSAFYALQEEEFKYPDEQLDNLRYIIFGGEKLNFSALDRWKKKYRDVHMINMYGITETTVHVTHKDIQYEDILSSICNIGKALPHLKIHLLDENSNYILDDTIGEMYIEGDGLARGYINKPTLTNEKFLTLPHISENRLYRTGDLGCYLPDGSIKYIGRADNQVKIRGHRIELEHIETHLNQFYGINQGIVTSIDTNGTDKMLQAFYTSNLTLDSTKISEFLSSKLPSHMIPASFKHIESFILTHSGKIDRKRVFECVEVIPEVATSGDTADGVSELQRKIVRIISDCFSELSLTHNTTIDMNFATIGLDSVTFIKTIVAIESEFNFEFDDEKLSISEFPTVGEMAEYVRSKVSLT